MAHREAVTVIVGELEKVILNRPMTDSRICIFE